MGNEMGNNNVSGLQESENDKFEAPRKSSEVHIAMSGDDNVKAKDQTISSSKEDSHESGEDLISRNTSLIGDSHTGKEVSAKTVLDADNTEEQGNDGFLRDLLKLNDRETETFSSSENGLVDQLHSASEKNPTLISDSIVQDLTEPETTEIQAALETTAIQTLDGSPKHQLVSDNTNDEGTCSAVSTEGGRFYEADSVSDENLSKTSGDQIQEQISISTGPVKSSTLFTSDGQKHEDTKSVSSPTDECSPADEYLYGMVSTSKEDVLGTSAHKVQKQTSEERESEELMNFSPNTTSEPLNSEPIESINQGEGLKSDNLDAEPYGKDRTILKRSDEGTLRPSEPRDIKEKEKEFENETKDAVDESLQHITSSEVEKLGDDMQREEIKFQKDTLVNKESEPFSSSEDGYVDEIASISEKNPAQTSDSKLQDHIEPETTEVQALHGSPRTQLVLNDSNDEGTPSVLSSEGEGFYKTIAASDENLSKTSDDQILRQISNDTDAVESSVELISHDLKDEASQPASSPEDGFSVEIVTAAEENELETTDHKVHKETVNEKEGEKLTNSSPKTSQIPLDSELTESISNDELKLDNVDAEPNEGGILQRRDLDTLGTSGPHNIEEENELEYERRHSQDEGGIPISSSETEKLGDGMQGEAIKSQEDALLDNSKAEETHVEETLRVLDVEPGVNDQQFLNLESDTRDSADSQLDVEPPVTLLESFQVENTKSEDKFVVLTDDTKLFENGYGIEQNIENPNLISHLASEEEPTVDKLASSVSSCASVADKAVANKGEARAYLGKNVEKTEMVKPVSFHLDSIEPDKTYSVHSVQNESEDANQNLTAMAPNTVENGRNSNSELKKENSIEADVGKSSGLHAKLSALMKLATLGISRDQCQGQEQISKITDSTCGHDSNMKLGSSDSKEGYSTLNEQVNHSPTVDGHTKSSFHVDSQIADITETQQAEPMNKKEAGIVFTASDVEVTHDFGRFSTETFSADVNIDGEVSTNGRGEVPNQSPPKYEEKTINSEVLKPNCYVSDLSGNQTGVGSGSPCAETEFSVQKEVKEDSVKKPSQDQTSEAKKLLTAGRTSTEKLSIPLLSYLQEENYSAGSKHKQEKLVVKKATKNKRNSHDDKNPGSITQGREKRKPKPLFFGICMCCTTEIL